MAGHFWRGVIKWFGRHFFGYVDPIARLRSVLDSYGVAYDVNDLVGRWRSSASILASEDALSGFPIDQYIPHDHMAEAILRRDYNYLVTFEVKEPSGYHSDEGAEYRSFYTNNDYTAEDWFAELLESEEAEEKYEGFSGELVGLVSVVHNIGQLYDRS